MRLRKSCLTDLSGHELDAQYTLPIGLEVEIDAVSGAAVHYALLDGLPLIGIFSPSRHHSDAAVSSSSLGHQLIFPSVMW